MAAFAGVGVLVFISMFVNGYQWLKNSDKRSQIRDIEKEIAELKGES